jgi:hypothetical protein
MRYLTINPAVIITPVITPVIESLEPYFAEAKLQAKVTSGLRDAYAQLRVVKNYVTAKHLDKKYPDIFSAKPTDLINDPTYGLVYIWQPAWSELLNIGIIINPPLAAKCLMDYIRDGKNKKGQLINQTPHSTGMCFDVGGAGGEFSTIKDELVVMQKAMNDKLPGLINILPEHGNNCIHCDCRPIK